VATRCASVDAARVLGNLGRGNGRIANQPLASGWTHFGDLPAPQGRTFLDQWRDRRGGPSR
jgi:L-lactate dehydrogenase complex protein LldF